MTGQETPGLRDQLRESRVWRAAQPHTSHIPGRGLRIDVYAVHAGAAAVNAEEAIAALDAARRGISDSLSTRRRLIF